MVGQDIISIDQFEKKDLESIFDLSFDMEENFRVHGCSNLLNCTIMASLFFEPSTRTKFSFDSAMTRLGGEIISTVGVTYSSMAKGETLEDTIKTVERYADVIVMRHPEKGSAAAAAKVAKVPVINAGDGPGEHPTQALLDFYTIRKEMRQFPKIKVAMVGDLKYGRTIHSLIKLLAHYEDIEFCLISPKELKIPEEYTKLLKEKDIKFYESDDFGQAACDCDVLYMTRIQKERFGDPSEYERLKGVFVLDKEIMKKAKKNMIVMHPLPRVSEIATEIDSDPRAKYFDQVENGVFVRMALLALVLGKVKLKEKVLT